MGSFIENSAESLPPFDSMILLKFFKVGSPLKFSKPPHVQTAKIYFEPISSSFLINLSTIRGIP